MKSTDPSLQWFLTKNTKQIQAIALVIHGLNLKPDKMESLIIHLNQQGIGVLNLSLSGHGRNFQPIEGVNEAEARLRTFKLVTYATWFMETEKACQHAQKRSQRYQVPLFFIGFSLGGLLGCDLLVSSSGLPFDKMVLFAPSLRLHPIGFSLKSLSRFSQVVIPSFAPELYRGNPGTPIAAYQAVFEAVEHFNHQSHERLNLPTLLFIDEKDEFVSCSQLLAMIKHNQLSQWMCHKIEKGFLGTEEHYHHLIIDESSVGTHVWEDMLNLMTQHLTS